MALFEMMDCSRRTDPADASSKEALLQLGIMHFTGQGVRRDLIAAHKWFNLAAIHGSADARRYRVEAAREMSNREIAEAQRQAREWASRTAMRHSPCA